MKTVQDFLKDTTTFGAGPVKPEDMALAVNPLLIMYRTPGDTGVRTAIHPTPTDRYEYYGLWICDIVRHVARAYKVSERDVWKWVDKERKNPTTDITNPS